MESVEEAVPIDALGDLIVCFSDQNHPEPVRFRVNSQHLREVSRFFNVLLDPSKFAEGRDIDQRRNELLKIYPSLQKVPNQELPHVSVHGIGRIGNVKNVQELLKDFLNIIHSRGEEFQKTAVESPSHHTAPRLSNICNLVAVAYHFGLVDVIKAHAHKQNIFTRMIKAKRVSKSFTRTGNGKWDVQSEETTRMMILLGFCLDYPPWAKESEDLIAKSSNVWGEASNKSELPLWFDLPFGLEDDLIERRNALVSALADIQTSLLQQYCNPMSATSICRYGYTSSRTCDLYQLGELTRFFHKNGSITLTSTIAGAPAMDPYDGDLYKAIATLKTCPPYQLDESHQHCGPRDALVERLEFLEALIPLTVLCQPCWSTYKDKIKWSDHGLLPVPTAQTLKSVLTYRNRQPWAAGSEHCREHHNKVRAILLADEHNWGLLKGIGN